MVILNRSLCDCGGLYQSEMMTPPNGSADDRGMNDRVSSDARHRKALTATPPPPVFGSWPRPSENRSTPSGPTRLSFFS
jgi:hypothetical protein